ncbi:alginate lyase family protein [Alkalihalobacillus sp. 1P02AB]|uniref:alginate lyase family protein n=1 Tax=Alkalihalobacillus sp. 1P02AB TaxID=3132260 RepID=UPI0039A70CBA
MNHLFSLLDLNHSLLLQMKEENSNKMMEEAMSILKGYFSNKQNVAFSDSEKRSLCVYSKENFQTEIEHVMNVSEQVINKTFLFQEAWDMEKTNVPVTFNEKVDWCHIPFEDHEWTYMLNRHRYFIPLGQSYLLTGDERYAQAFCELLLDWINSNPQPCTLTWRTIDVGLRISNWIKAFGYFKKSPHFSPILFEKMMLSLYEQGQYLVNNHTNWKKISNWGVIENKGLFELSLFAPEFKSSKEWQQKSLERLNKTTQIQVMKDGMHWEQSPMYHNEVLLCYLAVIHLGQKHFISISEEISTTAKKMAYADLYMAKPNHHQPMKGDSDSFDMRDIITMAAILFKDSTLKFGGFPSIDFSNLWLFGVGGMKDYHALPIKKPQALSCGFEDSGNFFMSSGWGKDDLYLYFHCGPLGGGHGHADLFHFDIHAHGRDLLTDLGRYNYSNDYPLRRELKSASAHNTTLVDQKDFTECIDTWGFGRIAEPLFTKWVSEAQFDYVEGSHNGYLYLDDPVHVTRKIVFVKPYYWLLIDQFTCKEEHTFTQNFHFSSCEISLDKETKSCSTHHIDGGNLALIPLNTAPLTVTIKESLISYEYNQVAPIQAVNYELKATGSSAIIQFIYPWKVGEEQKPTIKEVEILNISGNLVDKKAAEAYKFTFPNLKEEHVILIGHQKPSLHQMSYIVDGTQVFGEIVLIKRKGFDEEIIVIKH